MAATQQTKQEQSEDQETLDQDNVKRAQISEAYRYSRGARVSVVYSYYVAHPQGSIYILINTISLKPMWMNKEYIQTLKKRMSELTAQRLYQELEYAQWQGEAVEAGEYWPLKSVSINLLINLTNSRLAKGCSSTLSILNPAHICWFLDAQQSVLPVLCIVLRAR